MMLVSWPQRRVFSSSGGNTTCPGSCFSSCNQPPGGAARLQERGRNLPPGVTTQSLHVSLQGGAQGLVKDPRPMRETTRGEAMPTASKTPPFTSSCHDGNTNPVA